MVCSCAPNQAVILGRNEWQTNQATHRHTARARSTVHGGNNSNTCLTSSLGNSPLNLASPVCIFALVEARGLLAPSYYATGIDRWTPPTTVQPPKG